jgi:DNA (cytosine-5)-methyltransferase 1
MSTQPGMDCETGRGLLFQEIIRMLKISKPKAFLLENVPGLYGMKDTFEHIVCAFEDSGYRVATEVCSSRGLTATSRKRLFFVGLRNDLTSSDETRQQDTFEFPFVPDLQLKSENIMDYDELPPEELSILRLVDDTMDRLTKSGRWRPHSLAWPNRPCDTITSHYGNAVGRGESQLVPGHAPHHPRRFSVRECARLMGFPNSYRLVPQKSTQGDMAYRKLYYRMFGNAVCPPIIAALAGAVLDHCQIPEKEKSIDWTEKGMLTAKALAMAATRSESVPLPMGCLVFN